MAGTSFVALYRGETIATARLVAVSADAKLAADVSAHLLLDPMHGEPDPVLEKLERGRRAALRIIRRKPHGPDEQAAERYAGGIPNDAP